MIRAIGWIGTQLLAFCAVPAVIQVIYQGHAEGYSFWFIAMWLLGEILTLIYVYVKHNKDLPLLLNYFLNIIFISIIIAYMI